MAPHQWRGVDVHGFESEQTLKFVLKQRGLDLYQGDTVLALTMNGPIFVLENVPIDSEEKQDFETLVVDDSGYDQMVIDSEATAEGWLGYKFDNGRTLELQVTPLICNGIPLPTYEIKGKKLMRRRVPLPADLVGEDGKIYHFLQYKKFPLMKKNERISIMSGLNHAKKLDHSEERARARMFKRMEKEVGYEMSPEEWEQYLYTLSFDDYQSKYKSDSDEDYTPSIDEDTDNEEVDTLQLDELEYLRRDLAPSELEVLSGQSATVTPDGLRRSARITSKSDVACGASKDKGPSDDSIKQLVAVSSSAAAGHRIGLMTVVNPTPTPGSEDAVKATKAANQSDGAYGVRSLEVTKAKEPSEDSTKQLATHSTAVAARRKIRFRTGTKQLLVSPGPTPGSEDAAKATNQSDVCPATPAKDGTIPAKMDGRDDETHAREDSKGRIN